jgi:rod shape-determining protein MreD
MKQRGILIVWLTLLIALILTILPLPDWVRPYRPLWTSLVLLYWCIALPHRIGVGTGFSLGILLDILTGTLLGQQAIGLSLLAYLGIQLHTQLRVSPLGQQAWGVLILFMLGHALQQLIAGVIARQPPTLGYWWIPIISALLWPWIFATLRDIRRRYQII